MNRNGPKKRKLALMFLILEKRCSDLDFFSRCLGEKILASFASFSCFEQVKLQDFRLKINLSRKYHRKE